MTNPTGNALNAAAGDVSEMEVDAAIEAYDAERCRLNEQWHGGKCEPMSAAAKANVRPIHRAALLAASKVRENSRGKDWYEQAQAVGDYLMGNTDLPVKQVVEVQDIAGRLLDAINAYQAAYWRDNRNGDMRQAMAAALSAGDALRSAPAEQDGGWLPIETAPKDGTEIDVWGRQSIHGFWDKWTEPQRVIDAKWCEHPLTGGHATWRDKRFDFDTIIKDVTHYRLIIAPPRSLASGSDGKQQA
jgi:hypothetical protein